MRTGKGMLLFAVGLLLPATVQAQAPGEWLKSVAAYPAGVDDAKSCVAKKLDQEKINRYVQAEGQRLASAMSAPMTANTTSPQYQKAMAMLSDPEVMQCTSTGQASAIPTLRPEREKFAAGLRALEEEYGKAVATCRLKCADCTGFNASCVQKVDREYNNGPKVRALAERLLGANRKPLADVRAAVTQCVAKRDTARAAFQAAGLQTSPFYAPLVSTNDLLVIGQIEQETQADCVAVTDALAPQHFKTQ